MSSKNRKVLLKSVAILIVALVLCVGTIYAWFFINREVKAEDFDIQVVDGVNIAMDLEMITSNGKKVKNFRNVLPGDVLILKLAFRNFTDADLNFDLAIKQVKYAIYKGGWDMKEDPDPDKLIEGVSMLNVFEMQIDEVERVEDEEDVVLSTPVPMTRLVNLFVEGETEAVVLAEEKIMAYTSKYYNITLRFSNDILDKEGNAITEAIYQGNTIPIAINTFQKQNFHIGIMQVIDKGEVEA